MRRIGLVVLPLVVLAGLLWLFAANISRDPSVLPSALMDKPAPLLALAEVTGADRPGFSGEAFVGRVSLVNVFASWCVPCRIEHPLLMELAARDDLTLFGINQRDAPENASAFLNELGNPYDAIGADRDGRASIEWGVYGVPETFLVDASGTIVYKHVGPLDRRALQEGLLPAIERAKAS